MDPKHSSVRLRMREASFHRGSEIVVRPTTLVIEEDAKLALQCATAAEAHTLALLAAGIAKATHGSVLIDAFDPRVQPVHCKRRAAYVPHEPLVIAPREYDRYLRYRAALWNIDAEDARERAGRLLEVLANLHEAFAYPVVAALIASPNLLVLDRPQAVYADAILTAADDCAIFSTHTDERNAAAYAPAMALR